MTDSGFVSHETVSGATTRSNARSRSWNRGGRMGAALAAFCLLIGVGALLVPPSVDAAPGAYHEDTKFGYAVKSPKNWRYIAMSADEKWIAAKFLSDKSCFWNDKETGMSAEFKPVMQVIVFVDEVVKKKVETEESEDGSTIWKTFTNPFKDYQDFLKDTYSGGGWYVSAEEEGKHRDIDVTKYEIKVEKLTYTGPKRIIAWVFHTPEVDFAVQFEILEGDYKKFKGDVFACLRSFKLVKRDGALSTDTTGKKKREKVKDEDELTQEERTAQRKRTEQELHEKVQSNLPDDWKVKSMGRFLVLNHADPKYAKKMVAHAEAVWSWL
ncbi:MAG: hypothetical protein GY944_08795, partial [bacterium]|nr:hypothetical protein [bacterium]